MSGLPLERAETPRANSGIEVSRPKMENEVANGEILSRWENLTTDLTIRSAPSQIPKNDAGKRTAATGIESVYQE